MSTKEDEGGAFLTEVQNLPSKTSKSKKGNGANALALVGDGKKPPLIQGTSTKRVVNQTKDYTRAKGEIEVRQDELKREIKFLQDSAKTSHVEQKQLQKTLKEVEKSGNIAMLLENLQKKITSQRKEQNDLNNEITLLEKRKFTLKDELEDAKKNLNEPPLKAKADKLQQDLVSAMQELREEESYTQVLKNMIRQRKTLVDEYKRPIITLRKDISKLEKQYENNIKTAHVYYKELNGQRKDMRELKATSDQVERFCEKQMENDIKFWRDKLIFQEILRNENVNQNKMRLEMAERKRKYLEHSYKTEDQMRTKLSKEKAENKSKIAEMDRDFSKLQKIIKVDKPSEVLDKKEQLKRTHEDLMEQTNELDDQIMKLTEILKTNHEEKNSMLEDKNTQEQEEFQVKNKKMVEMGQSMDEQSRELAKREAPITTICSSVLKMASQLEVNVHKKSGRSEVTLENVNGTMDAISQKIEKILHFLWQKKLTLDDSMQDVNWNSPAKMFNITDNAQIRKESDDEEDESDDEEEKELEANRVMSKTEMFNKKNGNDKRKKTKSKAAVEEVKESANKEE